MSEGEGMATRTERVPVRPPDGESFAAALDAALRAKGISGAALRRSLGYRGVSVSVAALSYWRSGRRQPEGRTSIEAVTHIEDILGLESGHLLDRIGPARRPGPRAARVPNRQLVGADDALAAAMERHRLDEERMLELSGHATTYLDEHRCVTRSVVRTLVRATVDGADRIPLFLSLERPTEDAVTFRVMSGGTLVDYAALSPDFFSGAIVLDRPLRVGETAIVEYEMTLPPGSKHHYFEEHLQHRTNEVVIWVRFHPDAVPRTCETYQVLGETETTTRVDLTGVTSAHYAGRGVGPGTVGVRWQW